MSTDGSARACGVGACARLIPTLGGPGEAAPGRPPDREPTDSTGLATLGRPRATGARGREGLYGSRRWRACGETYSRRRSSAILDHDASRIPHWRDHGLGSSHTANPKNYRFHPQVLAVSVSLDHERTERSSNRFCRYVRGSAKCVGRSTFLGTYLILNPQGTRESRVALSSLDCARRVAASADAHSYRSTQHGQQQSATICSRSAARCAATKNVSPV